MGRLTMTENELLEAIRAAQEQATNVEGALSVQEIVDATGIGISKVRRLLKQLLVEGKAEEVTVHITPLGRNHVMPTTRYRVKSSVLAIRKAG
jgi:predicted MarR family transcription regulator